ncbi:MAG: molybdenum cofactor guanylyltransferase [Nitrospirales bacterium]
MIKLKNISGVVLAGGKSQRMGQDKRYLHWQGRNLLDSVCGVMNEIFDEVIVVTAIPDYERGGLSVRFITDEIPGKGSIGGLFSGLFHSQNPYCFVVACDMPYLNREVIGEICLSPPADVVVVKLLQGFQPLHARYSKQCLPFLEEMIHADNLKIQHLISDARISSRILDEAHFSGIDPHLRSFINVNTPSDWEFARKAQRN